VLFSFLEALQCQLPFKKLCVLTLQGVIPYFQLLSHLQLYTVQVEVVIDDRVPLRFCLRKFFLRREQNAGDPCELVLGRVLEYKARSNGLETYQVGNLVLCGNREVVLGDVSVIFVGCNVEHPPQTNKFTSHVDANWASRTRKLILGMKGDP
jgi:hypothetical protein